MPKARVLSPTLPKAISGIPTGIPHSIQGLKPDGCEFLLVFDDGNFSEYETVLAYRLDGSHSARCALKEFWRE